MQSALWKARHARRAIPVAVLMAALLLGSACSKDEKDKQPVVAVQVAAVEKTTIQRTLTSEALLFPLQQAALVPKISAPVAKFYVRRGSHVRRGQLLALLENRDLAASEGEKKGSYQQAEATYQTITSATVPQEVQKAELDAKAAKQAMDAAQKLYESRQKLYQQGALPRRDLDQGAVSYTEAKNNYELAQKRLDALLAGGKKQQLEAAAGQLAAAKGQYLGAQAQLSYSQIHSPINGVIADRPLYPGEMAAAGAPLMTVMDISQVIARAHIPQQEAALLKVGDPATISSPDGEELHGKVTVVSPALDPNSTTVEIWAQAANPKERFKPGSSVRLSVLAQTVPEATVIPAVALLTGPSGETSVMVAGSDGKAHHKPVKTGVRQGDQVQVVAGLQPGERVITVGAYGLTDNTQVRVEQPTSQESETGGDKPEPDKSQKKDSD